MKQLQKICPSAVLECKTLLIDLAKSGSYGIKLENKFGMDLTEFYKIYFYNATYRIVYKVFEEEKKIKVVGIGERADLSIYKKVYEQEKGE